ncbi:MAG: DUF4956 domain-containing protein [Chloroflexota bacterium]|nr:DUF4956 domain-containing protein [Anaerolineales bacterium]
MEEIFGLTNPAPLSLLTLTVNLLLSLVLSGIVAWFYTEYGRSFSNRAKFAQTLPLLAMITVLIIAIVKSSLALSLGLVGALSIVRFRTAIKEPEELLYLFLALAIGLGLGAEQRWPTIVAVAVMLGYLFLRASLTPRPPKSNLYLRLSTTDEEETLAQINAVLTKHARAATLQHLERMASALQTTYLIDCPDEQSLTALMDNLRAELPDSEFSFVEQDNTLIAA